MIDASPSRGDDAAQIALWEKNRWLYQDGLRQCTTFRERLLRDGASGVSHAKLIAMAIERFPHACRAGLQGRINLDDFHVSADDFLQQIRGRSPLEGQRVFGDFAGRWYGVWDQMRVDHHWGPVQTRQPPQLVRRDLPRVVSDQFCWIGDGFCWNYVAQLDCDSPSHVVLGMCYHLDASDATQIRLRRPHVGYAAAPGRLVWVTGQEIFFEQVLLENDRPETMYAITGFRYDIRDSQLESRGSAFQAIYTRRRDQRPPWFQFPIGLRVSGELTTDQ
jgi:hypothetical protein